jgi:hypothetical protein
MSNALSLIFPSMVLFITFLKNNQLRDNINKDNGKNIAGFNTVIGE